MLTEGSCFFLALLGALAQRFEWFGENEQNHFFMIFQPFQLRLLPGITRHQCYIQSKHGGRPGPDEDDFEKISNLYLEIPKRMHPRTEVLKN